MHQAVDDDSWFPLELGELFLQHGCDPINDDIIAFEGGC